MIKVSKYISSAGERWTAFKQRIGKRLASRLFEEIAKNPDLIQRTAERRISLSLLLAYVLATLVYAASITFLITGIAILLNPWGNIFTPIAGVVLVLMCIAARPRFANPFDDILPRSDYPLLYSVSDRIARQMGARPLEGIARSADFNASYRLAGLRNKPYMELGAALLAILNREERIALIAHELAHGANRDPLRAAFLHNAVFMLEGWASAIRPTCIGKAGEGVPFGPIVSTIAIPVELLMALASEVLLVLKQGLLLLALRESQRAEYFADRLAASVAGSEAMRTALEKLYLADIVGDAIRRYTWARQSEPIGEVLLQAVSQVPESQLESLRNESLADLWQADATHPPTALRVEMFRICPIASQAGLLSTEEMDRLDEELERIVAWSRRELVNRQNEADEFW